MNDSVTMHTGPLGSTIHVPHVDAGDDAQPALTVRAASDADTEELAPPSGSGTSPGGAVRRACIHTVENHMVLRRMFPWLAQQAAPADSAEPVDSTEAELAPP